MSQQSAHAQCISDGGMLPVIKNDKESIYMQEKVGKSMVWLDIVKSSQNWRTSSGSLLTYNNWYENQTLNMPAQNCAVVVNRGVETGWKKESCDSCKNVVCRKGKKNFYHSFYIPSNM